MKNVIFNLANLAKIEVVSNLDLDDKLDFDDIYSTVPMCTIDENADSIDCQISVEFVENEKEQGFYYNEDFSIFKITCTKENYYVPDVTFLMLCVFASKIQNKGYYLVHSSAMKIDGQGVLFVGPSGSGKTNISLSMAKNHDAEYISGDMTLVQYDIENDKVYLVGGTHSLTAFENIVESMYGKGCTKDLGMINGKKILSEKFLKDHNIKFAEDPCELKLIVNIRGGLKSYIKKDYDKPERIIKVIGMISEWIRTHSNYCVSTSDFFPDMDNVAGAQIRNMAIQTMSNVKQFSVYGPYDESAKVIYEQMNGKEKI